jgi:hypothetical protein
MQPYRKDTFEPVRRTAYPAARGPSIILVPAIRLAFLRYPGPYTRRQSSAIGSGLPYLLRGRLAR